MHIWWGEVKRSGVRAGHPPVKGVKGPGEQEGLWVSLCLVGIGNSRRFRAGRLNLWEKENLNSWSRFLGRAWNSDSVSREFVNLNQARSLLLNPGGVALVLHTLYVHQEISGRFTLYHLKYRLLSALLCG